MALSASFKADFSSFYDAVQKADKYLTDLGDGADKIGKKLGRMTDDLNGKKLIQEATLMAKAVEDVGGVSTLTAAQIEKLGATTNEAVEKMQKLGMDVPKNLQAIADQTKQANKETSDWMGTLTSFAGALGIAFSIDAVVGFIGGVFDAASAISDFSANLGISTDAVQDFQDAAGDSGVDFDKMAKSIQFVGDKLAEATPLYDALLKNIGLSGPALRDMKLEDVYKEIAKAIRENVDETHQLDIATGLYGPNAAKLMGAIRDKTIENADATSKMSAATIKNLKDAQKAWHDFFDAVTVESANFISGSMVGIETLGTSWKTFGVYMAKIFQGDFAGANNYLRTQAAIGAATEATSDSTLKLVSSHGKLVPAVKTTAQIEAEQKAKEDALKKAQEERQKAQDDLKKSQDDYNKSIADYYTKIAKLGQTLSGVDLIGKAEEYMDALKTSIPIQNMTHDKQAEINKVMVEAIGAYEAMGEVAPRAMYDIRFATQQAATDLGNYNQSVDEVLAKFVTLGGMPKTLPGQTPTLEAPKDAAKEAEKEQKARDKAARESAAAFSYLNQELQELARTSSGVIGDIAKLGAAMVDAKQSSDNFGKGFKEFKDAQKGIDSASTITGLTNMAGAAVGVVNSFQQATAGTDKLHSTLNGAAIGFSVAGPWGAAVGAAAGLIKGFFNAAKDRKELIKMRADFIEASGGINALTEAARDAGTNLDALLAAHDTAGAKKAIDDLNASLTDQQTNLDLVVQTAQKYGFTIEELGPAMARQELDKQAQQLYQDYQVLLSSGIDQVKVTERMSEAVNDYVGHALKMGAEIPIAMEPMIKSMIKSGDLLDENGEAITDLDKSGIKFSMTMSEGFSKLITTVEKLTDSIARSLNVAIKDIPDVKVKGTVNWDVPPVPTPKGPTVNASGDDTPQLAKGSGGFVNWGTGTPVVLHGWEAVVPKGDAASMAMVGGASMSAPGPAAAMPAIVINAQGAFFDTPASMQRLADKVTEALTAKHSVMNKLRAAV